jgi:hypothetical protein
VKNEEQIKKKIVEYRERGVCDREGHTIPPEKRSQGKGDRNRTMDVDAYRRNYEKAFGHS